MTGDAAPHGRGVGKPFIVSVAAVDATDRVKYEKCKKSPGRGVFEENHATDHRISEMVSHTCVKAIGNKDDASKKTGENPGKAKHSI